MADRLSAISKEIGFALWQIQNLEGAAAQFYVMVALAQQGMGLESGMALVRSAQAKTFGSTVNRLVRDQHLPPDIAQRFQSLLSERNWLVHNSHATSRAAVYNDQACQQLLARVEAIGDEAGDLLRAIGTLGLAFVAERGVSADRIRALTTKTLNEWQSGD